MEDNEGDVFLIREALQSAHLSVVLQVFHDGEQAIQFFDQVDQDAAISCPALVILDINLPKKQGGEVLEHMRKSRRCRDALVIVVSTSEMSRDRLQMTRLGANTYFRKPSEYEEFMRLGEIVKNMLSARSPQ